MWSCLIRHRQLQITQYLRFSQHCCWIQVFWDVMLNWFKNYSWSTSPLKMKAPKSFKMSGTTCTMTVSHHGRLESSTLNYVLVGLRNELCSGVQNVNNSTWELALVYWTHCHLIVRVTCRFWSIIWKTITGADVWKKPWSSPSGAMPLHQSSFSVSRVFCIHSI